MAKGLALCLQLRAIHQLKLGCTLVLTTSTPAISNKSAPSSNCHSYKWRKNKTSFVFPQLNLAQFATKLPTAL